MNLRRTKITNEKNKIRSIHFQCYVIMNSALFLLTNALYLTLTSFYLPFYADFTEMKISTTTMTRKKMFIQSEVWNVYNKNNQRFENVYVQISNFVVFRPHMTLGYVQRVWWVSAIKYTHTKVICHCLTSQMNLWHFFHSIFVLTLSEGRGDCAVSVWQRIDNFLSLQFPRIQWAIEMRMTQI